jgi:hypothetical protein
VRSRAPGAAAVPAVAEDHPGDADAGERDGHRVLAHRARQGARDLARLAAEVVARLGRHAVEGEAVLEFVERAGEARALLLDLAFDLGRGTVVSHGHGWSPP